MANSKHTMKKLHCAALSLLLCMSMLIGTTFAWFADSVSSANNQIMAGNLDVQLEYRDASGSWLPVTATTNVFEEGALWEPGHTEVVYLKLSNLGTLALKYNLGIHVVSETSGTNYYGETFKLSDYIRYGVIQGRQLPFDSREEAVSALESNQPIAQAYTNFGSLEADHEIYLTLVVYMPTVVGNEANYRDGMVPSVDLGIDLVATQYTRESDSFGSTYDNVNLVGTAAQLKAALSAGGYVMLGSDITVEESLYIPSDVAVTLNLNGKTLQTPENSAVAASLHVIVSDGDLTIIDTAAAKGKIISNNYLESGSTRYGGFAIKSVGGDLLIDGAVLDGNNWSYTVYVQGGSVKLTDATVSGRGAVYVCGGAHAEIYSGQYTIDVLTTNARDNVVFLDGATADICGGNFDGLLKELGTNDTFNWKGSSCLMLCGKSTANVYGGTFQAREADLFVHDRYCAIYVHSGSFNTVNALGNSPLHEHAPSYPATNIIEIYGGTYVYDPSDYLGEGYVVTENDGSWTVRANN